MSEKFAVVINISKTDLRIPELKQILPCGHLEERFVLPFDIAMKYKQFLHPLAVIDPNKQDEPMQQEDGEFIPIKPPKKVSTKPKVKKDKPLKGIKISAKKCGAKHDQISYQQKYYPSQKKKGDKLNEIQSIPKIEKSTDIS